jgi:hypothetical protein
MMPDNNKINSTNEQPPQVAATPAAPSIPPTSSPTVGNPTEINLRDAPAQTSSPTIAADDSDLIEEEWIVIVKRILKEHKDDPYLMSRAMTILRADYLKKRYKKDIKIPE